MLKKLLGILWLFIFVIIFSACDSKKETEIELPKLPIDSNQNIVDKSDLYGVFYELNVRDQDPDFNFDEDIELMKNLGVTYVRIGLGVTTFLTSVTKVNKQRCDKMHEYFQKLLAANINIHAVITESFTKGAAVRSYPKRDISSDSYYIKWLNDFYVSCKTIATEFKEINMWGIQNETNYGILDMDGNATYTYEEKAQISLDVTFYGTQAIKNAIKDAKIQLAGPVGLKGGQIKKWFELTYSYIKSGEYGYFYGIESKDNASKNADDYFDIVSWHPYVHNDDFNKEMFRSLNTEIYNIILENEGKHKPVIFSEFGYTNEEMSEEQAARNLKESYEVIKDLPFVMCATYFKMFDYGSDTYYLGRISRYGLFYDPLKTRQYTDGFTDDIVTCGGAKKQAYAYQEVAQGNGTLDFNEIRNKK